MNFDPHRPLSGIDQDAADCVAAMRGNSYGTDRYDDPDADRADLLSGIISTACVVVVGLCGGYIALTIARLFAWAVL